MVRDKDEQLDNLKIESRYVCLLHIVCNKAVTLNSTCYNSTIIYMCMHNRVH
jgi:hypothetical protein